MIITAAALLVSCASDNENMFKGDIFKLVKDNLELLEKAPGEIKGLDRQAFFISTTEKRDIEGQLLFYNMEDSSDYDSISGLYMGAVNEDGSGSFSGLENSVLSEVLGIDGVSSIRIVSDPRFTMSFYCGGELTGKAIFYGFYYTEDGLPIGFKGEDVSLTESGGGWTWKGEDSRENYYTEKISGNWFYYKMNFGGNIPR